MVITLLKMECKMSKIVHFRGYRCILRSDNAVDKFNAHWFGEGSVSVLPGYTTFTTFVPFPPPPPATYTEVLCTSEKSSVEIITLNRPCTYPQASLVYKNLFTPQYDSF